MLITITNTFHDTSTKTHEGIKSREQARAIKQRLCGVAGCTCSNAVGARGYQADVVIEEIGPDSISITPVNQQAFLADSERMHDVRHEQNLEDAQEYLDQLRVD